MSIVIGTQIFSSHDNDVDIPLSRRLALGFNQYNELSVRYSDGNVWEMLSPSSTLVKNNDK